VTGKLILSILILAVILMPGSAWGWGTEAHQLICDNARDLLPSGLKGFFRAQARAVREASLEPDTVFKKEYGEEERVRHYFNLDLLERPPFAAIPRDFQAGIEKYGAGRMEEAGQLPWRIDEILEQLTADFRAGRWTSAAIRAGHLAHYVADATQPLHGTVNYDGQKTGNNGIHQRFEADLLTLDFDRYRKTARKRQERALYIQDPVEEGFRLLIEAYPLNRAILEAEDEVVELEPGSEEEYLQLLEERLRDLTEARLAAAGTAVASFWVTAWINAGKVKTPF
jgi:hypothetical protein